MEFGERISYPDIDKVDKKYDVDMQFLSHANLQILKDKREELGKIAEQIAEIDKQIAEISEKSLIEKGKLQAEIEALTAQRDRNRKVYEKELIQLEKDLDAKVEAAKVGQDKEMDRTIKDFNSALKESEEYYAQRAGKGDFDDKTFKYNRGQVLVEEYGTILESLEEALSQLTYKRNQEIIKLGKEIEQTSSNVHKKAEESSDVNKAFKEELAKREQEHLIKVDELNRKYASERAKYETEISNQISEVKHMEDMYSNIHQHNKEQLDELEKDIERLQEVITKSSAANEQPKPQVSNTNSLIEELSFIEGEIERLKKDNQRIRDEISSNDSYNSLRDN